MFSTRLKKILFKNKVLDKKLKKRIKSKKFITKATNSMNSVRSKKYGLVPKETEARSLANNVFKIKYNFYSLKKTQKNRC